VFCSTSDIVLVILKNYNDARNNECNETLLEITANWGANPKNVLLHGDRITTEFSAVRQNIKITMNILQSSQRTKKIF